VTGSQSGNKNNFRLIAIIVLLEIPVAALAIMYGDRFLLPWAPNRFLPIGWAYPFIAMLLAIVIWLWYFAMVTWAISDKMPYLQAVLWKLKHLKKQSTSETRPHNLKNIRALLTERITDEELRSFCYDTPEFVSVYNQLGPDTSKSQVIDRLIKQAGRKSQLEILLALAEKNKPARYEKHQPYYDDSSRVTTSGRGDGKSQDAKVGWIGITILATMVWGATFGWFVWHSLYPEPIPPDEFGIAVALFGEGPDYRVTKRGREISNLLYEDLDSQIRQTPELKSNVVLKSLGVIRNFDQGIAEGRRVGAKLVISGRVVENEAGTIVHFQVLETPTMTDNPSVPQIIPVTRQSLQTNLDISGANSIDIKEMAGVQSLAIASFSLGLYYFFQLDNQQAAEQFELTLAQLQNQLGPDTIADLGLVYFYLARSYQVLGKFKESQKNFLLAEKYISDDPAIPLGQMYNYRVFGQEESRQHAFAQVIKLANDLPSDKILAIYNKAVAYEMAQQYEAALLEYQAIQKINPEFFLGHLGIGRMLVELERLDEAETLYQTAMELAQDDPAKQIWVYLDIGKLQEKQGDIEAAIGSYKRANQMNSNLVSPYFHLAELYNQQKLYDAAYFYYNKITEVSQTPSWAYGLQADFLRKNGDTPDAIQAYHQALRYPAYDAPLLRTYLGELYAEAAEAEFPDKKTLALAAYQKALQDPGLYEAYIRSSYGKTLAQFREVDEAIVQLEKSAEIDEGPAIAARMNLGLIYTTKGDIDRAKSHYQYLIKRGNEIDEELLNVVLGLLNSLEN